MKLRYIPNFQATFYTDENGTAHMRMTNSKFPEHGAIWFGSPLGSDGWTMENSSKMEPAFTQLQKEQE